MKTKIYGHGWVGRAQQKLFPESIIVDPIYSHYTSSREKKADIAFVCVPTPLLGNELDCSLVEEIMEESEERLIIVRSTVMPGTCDKFRHKNVVFQPEYLGETVGHPFANPQQRPFLIIGGSPENRRRAIDLYSRVYNANVRIRQVSNYEAEIIKLSENRAIAFKVAQCQELYDVCEKAGVDYNVIREAVYGDDPRFNLYWTAVYPDARGFNSKCIPKDVYGWAAWAESLGYVPNLTKMMLAVNREYIRQYEPVL